MLKAEVLKVAMPFELKVAVPSMVPPVAVTSVKVTVPVGTADPVNAGVTVAVKDTCWFVVDGAGDDTTPVVVLAAETTSAPLVAAARPEKFESPL